MENLIKEIRREFQIPPYFEDEGIESYLREGIDYLTGLNPGRNYDNDLTYRSLLKNYVYYAYHHKLDEWKNNYMELILEWQMGSVVEDD